MNRKIFVVIPVFNRLNYTKKCISSIFAQTYKKFEVILVNDGSTDNTEQYISSNFPKVKIIKGNGNWWWTKSMFEGVKYVLITAKKTDYILEMNNDLYFDKNYFKTLVDTAKNYKNSIIGSICVRAQRPTEVVEAGVRIDWSTGLVYGVAQTISNKLLYYKNMEVVDDIDALPGKGTLIPVSVFSKKVNFKFKEFPHYIADYEFAINAKKHGYNLLVSTRAVAKHYWEATGLSGKTTESKKSYSRALSLLFGRKSMNNIIDWIKFVNISCPDEFKYRNYYFSLLKVIKAALTVFPFYYLIPIFRALSKVYHYSKLQLYRVILKIRQFPEYHLHRK